MIQDFGTVKAQLAELAGVINSFKSEAVQLKIIELVLGRTADVPDEVSVEKEGGKTARKPAKRREPAKAASGTKKKRKTTGGTGATATLSQLAEGDFFKTARTINDIIEHCRHNLALTFKANEFSGKLARMVRNNDLTREKNTDNQYEYTKA